MSEEGRLVAGRYRLVERIGSGAMGVVWRALDDRLNREVAVKQLVLQPGLPPDEAEEAVARCLREGRIAAKLHHPNAIGVFDVVDDDGAPWLVMEYLPSVSLAAALADRGPLPVAEVARIGAQVAAALAAAHAAGIVHRDIKPGNILLGDDGSVKITDFGISRATDDVTVTKTGLIAGTPAYLSPEVAVGRDPSAASDVFSLGSTLYAAAEGEPPFGLSENTLGLLHAVASGKINPPQRSGPLTPVLIALLAAETGTRPSAAEARDLLSAVAQGEEPELPATALVLPVAAGDGTTRVVTAAAAVSTGSRKPVGTGTGTGTGRPVAAPPPAKSHRPLMFASAGVALVLAMGAWWMVADDRPAGSDQQVPSTSVIVLTQNPPVTTSVQGGGSGAPVEEPTTAPQEVTATTTDAAAPPPPRSPAPRTTTPANPTTTTARQTTTTTATSEPTASSTAPVTTEPSAPQSSTGS